MTPEQLQAIRGHLGLLGVGMYYTPQEIIAHARRDIPTLLAEVERLKALAEQLAGALTDADNWITAVEHAQFPWDWGAIRNIRAALAAYKAAQEVQP